MKFIKRVLKIFLFLSLFLYSLEYSAKNKEKSNIPIEVPTVYTMSTMKPIISSNLEAITKKFKKINGPIFVKVDNENETKPNMTNDTILTPPKNETNNTNDIQEKVKMLEKKLNEYEQQLNQLISSKNNSEKTQTNPTNDAEKESKEEKQNENPPSTKNTGKQETSNPVDNTQTLEPKENNPIVSQNDKSKKKNEEDNKEKIPEQSPQNSEQKEKIDKDKDKETPTQPSENNKKEEEINKDNNNQPGQSQTSHDSETKNKDTNKETKETNKEDEKKENENTQTDEHNQPTKGNTQNNNIPTDDNPQKEKDETNNTKQEENNNINKSSTATSPETSSVNHNDKINNSQPSGSGGEPIQPVGKKDENPVPNSNKNQKENESSEETNEDEEEEAEPNRKKYHLRHPAFIQKDIMFPNPCYNKGYISKTKRTIGIGNYSQCFLANLHKQKAIINSNLRINSNYTLLTQTEKKLVQILFPNNNNFTYTELREKVKKICSMEYSSITQEYSETLPEDGIDNLCLNLTLFTIYLETLQNMNENSLIINEPVESQVQFEESPPKTIVKQQKESIIPTSTSLITILSNPQIKNYVYIVFICLLCLALLYILNERIANFFIGIYSNKIMNQTIDYPFIQDQLNYQNVKYYLFYSDTSVFKTKYGKEFKVENLTNEELIEEVRLMSLNDKNLTDLMKNNKITDFKWKISLGLYTFNLVCALFGVVMFGVLISKIWIIYGFKSVLTVCLGFNLFLGIFLVLLFVCMQIEVEGKRKI